MADWYFYNLFNKDDKVHCTKPLTLDNLEWSKKNRKTRILNPTEILTIKKTPADKPMISGEPNSYDVIDANGQEINNLPEYLLLKVGE